MDRGTYSATSAGYVFLRNLEVISNNLANINTAGFKRQYIGTNQQTFEETLAAKIKTADPYAKGDHERTPGAVNLRTFTDFSVGAIRDTGNPLDVALSDPKTFFVVTTPDGPQYTRAGNFTLNANGELVTQDGLPVASDGGSIVIQRGKAEIASNGAVLVDGQPIGVLQIVKFAEPERLKPVGGARFAAGGLQPEAVQAEVVPGSVEMANVSAISSMVEMIVAQRAFEMYTRSARTIDGMNSISIQQIGQPR